MSAKKEEPALRAAADALFAAGWYSVTLSAYKDPPPDCMDALLECGAAGTPRQSIEVRRKGDTFTIDRYDGVHRVGKPIEATGANALARVLAQEPPPTRRK